MMDFGPPAAAKPTKSISYKKTIYISLSMLVIIGAGLIIYFYVQPVNPLPPNIKKQIDFKVVYPAAAIAKTNPGSYQFEPKDKILSFTLDYLGANVVITEQQAPVTAGSGSQIYYPALGIHPYAQFESKLGPVALTRFYNPGSLQPVGQSGVMIANGTMVVAHPSHDLTNEQWKNFFDNLKTGK